MSAAVGYLVVDVKRGASGMILDLDGPFAYPKWGETLGVHNAMTFIRAHAFALAYSGIVVPLCEDPCAEAKRSLARMTSSLEPAQAPNGWAGPWGF